jgi:lipid A 4'-phosphatase
VWCGLLYAIFRQKRRLSASLTARTESQHGGSGRVEILSWAAIVGLLAAVVFVVWPEIDLGLSTWFNLAPRAFLFDYHIAPLTTGIKGAASLLTWLAVIATVIGIGTAISGKHRVLGLELAHWLFLFLVLVLGPTLLVNNVLKEHSGRPRPMHLEQFGGPSQFKAVFHSGDCARNCSFVSGEAASIYALGFAIALLARRRREAVLIATVLAGSVVGFIRIGQGAHFVSDIVFAGVFMAIVVVVIHWLVFRVAAPRLGIAPIGDEGT